MTHLLSAYFDDNCTACAITDSRLSTLKPNQNLCKCVTEQYHVKYVCVIGQQGQLLVLHSIVFLAGDICHISVSLRSRRQKIKSCSIQFVDIFQYVSTSSLSIHRIWTLDTILKMKHRHSASDLTFSFYPSKSVKCERIIDCSDNMTANEL